METQPAKHGIPLNPKIGFDVDLGRAFDTHFFLAKCPRGNSYYPLVN